MKTEIETRFLEIDKMRLILKLTKLKAVDLGEVKLSEVIFYDQDLNWLKDNKLVKLRKDNNIVKLIYKNNKEQKTDSAKEIEFDVSNMDKAKEFGASDYITKPIDTELILRKIREHIA